MKFASFKETLEGVDLAGLKVHIDWARFAAATELDKSDPELFTVAKGILGDQFAAIIGVNDKAQIGSLTFGPNAIEASKALLSGSDFGGGESGLLRASADNIGVVTIRMETLLKAVSFIPGLASKIELIKKLPAERPIVATMNADAKKVDLRLALPIDVMQVIGDIQK